MKRYLTVFFAIISLALLSGCSLPGAQSSRGSLWRSTDGGKTWEAKTVAADGKTSISDVNIISLAIDSVDSKIYVGLKGTGILKSENGGAGWKYMNFQAEKVYGLATDPGTGGSLYASGVWQKRGKVWKTSDGGEKWKEIYAAPSNGPLVVSLETSRTSPDVVYISTSDNLLLKSRDRGETWKKIFKAPSPIVKISVDASDSNLVYFITQSGDFYRSKNGGDEFENLGEKDFFSGLKEKFSEEGNAWSFSLIQADTVRSGWVYLAGKGGILKSRDAGNNWEKINALNDPENFPITALAVSPIDPDEIVYGASQTLYRSYDGGKNWATNQFESGNVIKAIRYDPKNSQNMFLGFGK